MSFYIYVSTFSITLSVARICKSRTSNNCDIQYFSFKNIFIIENYWYLLLPKMQLHMLDHVNHCILKGGV